MIKEEDIMAVHEVVMIVTEYGAAIIVEKDASASLLEGGDFSHVDCVLIVAVVELISLVDTGPVRVLAVPGG